MRLVEQLDSMVPAGGGFFRVDRSPPVTDTFFDRRRDFIVPTEQFGEEGCHNAKSEERKAKKMVSIRPATVGLDVPEIDLALGREYPLAGGRMAEVL